MRTIIKQVSCGGLTAIYRQDEAGTVELLLLPAGMEGCVARDDCAAEPLVQFKLLGGDSPAYFSGGRTMRGATPALKLAEQREERDGDSAEVTTVLTGTQDIHCIHTLTLFAASGTAEVRTAFCNDTGQPLTLEMLSSFTLGSLSPFSLGLAPETLVIHRMRSTWSAEGRLESRRAEELQLEPSWKLYSANSVRFGSVGSFPVREWEPLCAVEDTVHHVTWAAATTHASSWQIELYRKDMGLSLSGGLADWELGHWRVTIQPGGCFDAPKAVLTAVRGGVEEAAQTLAGNLRRYVDPALPDWERELPVLFNEFCSTWGKPTEESVLRHLDALKGHGIDTYVIDAGWYDDSGFEDAARLGKWEVSRTAFPHGIKAVVDTIHRAGMKAGIWFEPEVAGRDERSCFNKTEWLLTRDGAPVTAGDRRFWDLCKPEVQEYLTRKVIDFLRENEFDYCKFDYNETIGVGCDGGDSPGEGLRQQIEAALAFYRRVRRELPGLVLESCSSGGHRHCHSVLEYSCMASFSDAHECDEIPIIAANMHTIMPPRMSQIWAVVKPEQPLSKLYYQICSGLLGRLCFSGEPEKLSPEQWAVMEEGIAFYRQAASVIDQGISTRLGPEIVSYRAPKGWQAVVRRGERLTLAVVHTFTATPETVTLPIRGKIVGTFARPGVAVTETGGAWTVISGLRDFDGAAMLIENEV